MNALQIYKKYAALRPKRLKERRFLLCYLNGRCTVQPVGKNFLIACLQKWQSTLVMRMRKGTQDNSIVSKNKICRRIAGVDVTESESSYSNIVNMSSFENQWILSLKTTFNFMDHFRIVFSIVNIENEYFHLNNWKRSQNSEKKI